MKKLASVCVTWFILANISLGFGFRVHNARWSPSVGGIRATVMDTTQKSIAEQATVKVPATAWRWPPMWPFTDDSFSDYQGDFSGNKATENSVQFVEFFSKNHKEVGKNVLIIGAPSSSQEAIAELGWSIQPSLDTDFSTIASQTYDSVIVMSGIDRQKQPRGVFRDIWRVLRPNGRCYACFLGGNGNGSPKPVKLWTTTTDEQKMWVVGSYCYYAVPEGWESVEGFDITGGSGEKPMVFSNDAATSSLPYMVSAKKINWEPLSSTSGEDIDTVASKLEPRLVAVTAFDSLEKKLMALRLASDLRDKSTIDEQQFDMQVRKVQEIYDILKDVKDSIIPRPAKITLAYLLINSWNNGESQRKALKMSVGLETPNDLWRPIGQATIKMKPKDKIYFLADLIASFGEDPMFEMSMTMYFPQLLSDVIAVVKDRLPDLDDGKVQTFAVDLLVAESIKSKFVGADRILPFVRTVSIAKLREFVDKV